MTFAPMPRRSPGLLTRASSAFWPAVREIEAQREPHAAFWDDWNTRAFASEGPLLVALGDSSSQGIGSGDPAHSWLPRIIDRLRSNTGEPWRAINLSITGAQLSDVIDFQLPRMDEMRFSGHEPTLVTHLAGANDLMAPATWGGTARRMRTILTALPDRAVVARVGKSTPLNGAMARMLNRIIEGQAEHRPFHLFWPWDWPSRDGLAVDRWHPGARGYEYMTDLIWGPVSESLGISQTPR
ncbi:MAG: SGNH/GDSL hydrolase family protein [Acidimicrobiales bacterium]